MALLFHQGIEDAHFLPVGAVLVDELLMAGRFLIAVVGGLDLEEWIFTFWYCPGMESARR